MQLHHNRYKVFYKNSNGSEEYLNIIDVDREEYSLTTFIKVEAPKELLANLKTPEKGEN